MNLELIFNLMNILFDCGSNNWVSVVISILVFCYNIYTKIKKQNLFSLIINARKENRSAGDRIAMIFKVKFIIYSIISMYALSFAIFQFFDDPEDYREFFKIFKGNTEDEY